MNDKTNKLIIKIDKMPNAILNSPPLSLAKKS